MKTLIAFSVIFLFGFHTISAQKNVAKEEVVSSATALTVSKGTFEDVLLIHCNMNIDYIILSDKSGRVILKEKPQNNQISISSLEPGFYMLDAYCNGVNIKKGIIKKLSTSFISGL